jgi:hypothetical protein
MIYLVAGLDQTTFTRWHEHVMAADATGAASIARTRAARQGLELVVAAVVGPYGSVEPYVAEPPVIARRDHRRPEAA